MLNGISFLLKLTYQPKCAQVQKFEKEDTHNHGTISARTLFVFGFRVQALTGTCKNSADNIRRGAALRKEVRYADYFLFSNFAYRLL